MGEKARAASRRQQAPTHRRPGRGRARAVAPGPFLFSFSEVGHHRPRRAGRARAPGDHRLPAGRARRREGYKRQEPKADVVARRPGFPSNRAGGMAFVRGQRENGEDQVRFLEEARQRGAAIFLDAAHAAVHAPLSTGGRGPRCSTAVFPTGADLHRPAPAGAPRAPQRREGSASRLRLGGLDHTETPTRREGSTLPGLSGLRPESSVDRSAARPDAVGKEPRRS